MNRWESDTKVSVPYSPNIRKKYWSRVTGEPNRTIALAWFCFPCMVSNEIGTCLFMVFAVFLIPLMLILIVFVELALFGMFLVTVALLMSGLLTYPLGCYMLHSCWIDENLPGADYSSALNFDDIPECPPVVLYVPNDGTKIYIGMKLKWCFNPSEIFTFDVKPEFLKAAIQEQGVLVQELLEERNKKREMEEQKVEEERKQNLLELGNLFQTEVTNLVQKKKKTNNFFLYIICR